MSKIVTALGVIAFYLLWQVDDSMARTHHDAPVQVCNDSGCNPVPHGCREATGHTTDGTPLDVIVCPMRKRDS